MKLMQLGMIFAIFFQLKGISGTGVLTFEPLKYLKSKYNVKTALIGYKIC
jgi:hypothetical protein